MSTTGRLGKAERRRKRRTIARLRAEARRTRRRAPSRYGIWKAAVDRAVAAVLLVPGLPIMAVLVLLVRITSRGPGIFRQVRVGKGGRQFTMYKIRTMRQDAEVVTGAIWCKPSDPRVTRLGRFLRRFHLDELPQLVNVLRGDMSLVGPRPERPEFVRMLTREIPRYRDRLAVRPGVTGLAQLNLPADTDFQSVRRKLVLDLEYIDTMGFFLDARLLLCTLARMLKIPAVRALGLRRKVHLPSPDIAPVIGANGNGSSGNGSSLGGPAHVAKELAVGKPKPR